MDLTKEALETVVGFAEPSRATFQTAKNEEFDYLITSKNQDVKLLKDPIADAVPLVTLTGLVDLLEAGFDGLAYNDVFIRVVSPDAVSVSAKDADMFRRFREYLTVARVTGSSSFQFGAYMSQEAFVIGLRTQFVQDDEVDSVVGLAGNLAAKTELKQEDDGFTQTATMRGGVHMVNEKVVKPRVALRPYRTFLEAQQAPGEFIFRVKVGTDGSSMCALFEADGGNWKLTAMQNVKTWLKNRLQTSEVEGLGAIPIIC